MPNLTPSPVKMTGKSARRRAKKLRMSFLNQTRRWRNRVDTPMIPGVSREEWAAMRLRAMAVARLFACEGLPWE